MRTDWSLTLRSSVFSFLLHAVAAGLLIFSFEFTPTPPALSRQAVNIISAVSVDRRQVEQELKQLQDSDKKKKVTEEKRQKELEKQASDATEKRLVEERKLAELTKQKEQTRVKRELEQKRLTQLEQKKKELEQKTRLEEEKKSKAEEEKKRLEEENKIKQAELKQIEEEKKELEQKTRLEEEKKSKVEEEKKRLEEENKIKEVELKQIEEEKKLQDELAAEQKGQEARQLSRDQAIIAKYTESIKREIQNNFNQLGLPKGLSCELLIRIIPGGDVVEATIVKSSGNAIFDRRAETAVQAASPLPVPAEDHLFEQMRELNIIFEP